MAGHLPKREDIAERAHHAELQEREDYLQARIIEACLQVMGWNVHKDPDDHDYACWHLEQLRKEQTRFANDHNYDIGWSELDRVIDEQNAEEERMLDAMERLDGPCQSCDSCL
ncbi:unnamed protein product [marine sediment metagenome]|uniref:Uncharacterized protein n=1 Tax=marine sediment metagenome TaxID=412755 RepID=X0UX40_9ZZZZ